MIEVSDLSFYFWIFAFVFEKLEFRNSDKSRKKMIQFAKRLQQYEIDTKNVNSGVTISLQRGISMQWATINTMRPAAAINIYKKYNANISRCSSILGS